MRRVLVVVAILTRAALRGLQGSPVTSGVAVATIAIALFLVGAFAIVVVNMRGMVERVGSDLQVPAYLEQRLSEAEQIELAERVASAPGVERVELVDRDEALRRFREISGGAALLEGLEENPLPASVEISLLQGHRTPEGLDILRASLDGLPGIEEVAQGQDWIEGYARAAALVSIAGYGLGTVLALATLLIVANTIRLGVYAREDELEILALVGASRTFVRAPFLMEGTLQGAIGGVIALALLWLSFLLFVPQLEYGLVFFIGKADPHCFAVGEMVRLVAGGACLGLLGSMAALMGWRF